MKRIFTIVGIIIAVLGLTLIFAPEECIRVIVIALGLGSIASGAWYILKVSKLLENQTFKRIILIRGLLGIVVGLVAIILPIFLANTIWKILVYTLAVYLLIFGSSEIYTILQMRSVGIDSKYYIGVSIASILASIIMFIIPNDIGLTVIRIVGGLVIACGAAIVIWDWKTQPAIVVKKSDVVKSPETETVDAEVKPEQ